MRLPSLDPHPYEHPPVGNDLVGPSVIGAVDEEHLGEEVAWMR